MNIVLIGFMGSGKSTVGRHLSELLQLPLIEMDDLVLQKTGRLTEGGELLWREAEIAVAKELRSKTNCIISTGGGVVLNKIILDYLNGKVFYLKTSFETLAKRVNGDPNRPLFHKKHYDFRLYLYEHYADEVIETDSQTAAEIALNIQDRLRSAHGR